MSRSSFGQPPQPQLGMAGPKGLPGPTSAPKMAPQGMPSPLQAPSQQAMPPAQPSMFRRGPRY